MSAITSYEVQSALLAYYKSQPSIVSLFVSGTVQMKESQWQGVDFTYPALRVYADVYPSVNGCGPDRAVACTEIYSEQKSSKEAKIIAGTISNLLHKKVFTSNGFKFSMVRIVKEYKAERSIYAWMSKLDIEVLVS